MSPCAHKADSHSYLIKQRGVALLGFISLVTLISLHILLNHLNAGNTRFTHEQQTERALLKAKLALIGDAASADEIARAGRLSLPDMGPGISDKEGESSPNFSGNTASLTLIGKFPWLSLATGPLRDTEGECLWLIDSGNFKKSPITPLNWDTPGKIEVIDTQGHPLARNLAALLVAPGRPLDGQDRSAIGTNHVQCGGNYDARNYLDAFDDADALAGEWNYFAGSTNNAIAPDADVKRFVLASAEHYNDRLLFVTPDELFDALTRRKDFSLAVDTLLTDLGNEISLNVLAIGGKKGTENLKCTAATNKAFCNNWYDMLFLTELSVPSSVTINGKPSHNCTRLLIFSGRRISGQQRTNDEERAAKENYLEFPNVDSFDTPKAADTAFAGVATFDWRNPGADVIRCIP